MTTQQIIVLMMTFVVGLFIGGYVYITGYAPQYSITSLSDNFSSSETLAIRGEQIGGCQMGGVCPSFELGEDRRYEYIPAHRLDEETPKATTGRLDRNTYDAITDLVAETDLGALTEPAETCNAAADGIDYRYDLIFEGVSYEFNSCGTAFYGSRLYNELLRLWGLMLRSEVEQSDE